MLLIIGLLLFGVSLYLLGYQAGVSAGATAVITRLEKLGNCTELFLAFRFAAVP